MVPTQVSCRVFFIFFLPPSDSIVKCRSPLIVVGCSTTYRHISRWSAETDKLNVMVFLVV